MDKSFFLVPLLGTALLLNVNEVKLDTLLNQTMSSEPTIEIECYKPYKSTKHQISQDGIFMGTDWHGLCSDYKVSSKINIPEPVFKKYYTSEE
jgi:hypothetical protein